MSARARLRRALLAIAAVAAWCWFSAGAQAAVRCEAVRVPVTVSDVPAATVYGELCRPAGSARGVQVLVHGATYNHHYWNWPLDPNRYSYVRKALGAGYATFNVDRLGAGQSTRPLSELVTIERGAEALHSVIQQLRSGAIGGQPFGRVIWVGHSFGTLYGWLEASLFGDVDAFVLTGMTHKLKPSALERALADTYPAQLDPKFANAGLDPGYLTSRPGTRRGTFYHWPTADPITILLDEGLKDTASSSELAGGVPLFLSPPPDGAPSRAINVPTLLVIGARDFLFCGPPDGPECSVRNILAQEAPYYSPEARLEVQIVPETGHNIQLHRTAPRTGDHIMAWLARVR